MPVLFDRYTLLKAQAVVRSRDDKEGQINRAYYNGDHWQHSNGWVGPRPLGASENHPTMQAIREAFVARNVVAELVSRHVNGILGRSLHWKLAVTRDLEPVETTDPETGETKTEDGKPTDAEQRLIDEATAALVAWWDKREIGEVLQNTLAAALLAKRGVLRLHVPAGMKDEAGGLPVVPVEDAVDYLWLQHVGTNDDSLDLQFPSATVYVDPDTRQRVGLFTYNELLEDPLLLTPTTAATVPKTPARTMPGNNTNQRPNAELTYLDARGDTVLRVLDAAGDIDDPMVMPLGGRLMMHEVSRRPLITPPMISQQNLLNMAMSMKQRNIVLAGYLERIFLNVKWPGSTDPATGAFVPDKLHVGAGATNSLQGSEIIDQDGKKTVASPSVIFRDPVSPDTFIATEASAYLAMLQEGHQLHYALAGDGQVSGESRKQARDAFQKDLQFSSSKVEGAARWVIETVLALAAVFSGQPGRYEGLRAYVTCRIDSGPIAPEDMANAAAMKEAGLWASETAMSQTGIEDVDAEMQAIEREREKEATRDPLKNIATIQAAKQLDEEPPGLAQRREPAAAMNGGSRGAR